jgi:hypothetical protein
VTNIHIEDLGKPKIIITLDFDHETYTIDVQHSPLSAVYVVLRSVIERIENGDFLTEDLDAVDIDGNPVSKEEVQKVIQELKKDLDSKAFGTQIESDYKVNILTSKNN